MFPKFIRTKIRVIEKGYLNEDFVNQHKNSNSIAGNLYGSKSLKDALLDHFEYKLEHLLKWEDRNSMWFSLESRVPFLDYRLVEKTLATTSDLKIKKGMTKYILRQAMKGVLPEKIRLRRDKIGFETPQDDWFRKESFKNRNLINPILAKEQYKKHLSGEVNIAKEIWKWVHLELWFREYIDKQNFSI
jgi:asparagine synthase (glutamine-hydrolysing)